MRGVIVLVKDFADGLFCEMTYLLEMEEEMNIKGNFPSGRGMTHPTVSTTFQR